MVFLSGIWNKLLLNKKKEEIICEAQEQALRTNSVKCYIDKTSDSPLCKLCGKILETVWHIVRSCANLAQEYKKRHDKTALRIHWGF